MKEKQAAKEREKKERERYGVLIYMPEAKLTLYRSQMNLMFSYCLGLPFTLWQYQIQYDLNTLMNKIGHDYEAVIVNVYLCFTPACTRFESVNCLHDGLDGGRASWGSWGSAMRSYSGKLTLVDCRRVKNSQSLGWSAKGQ